jgi:hypothetical protein
MSKCVGMSMRWKRKRNRMHCFIDGLYTRYTILKLQPILTLSQLPNSSYKTRTMSPRPRSRARSMARFYYKFLNCRLTPFSSIFLTISLWPPLTAYMRGVHPSRFLASISTASCARRYPVKLEKPCLALLCKIVSPRWLASLGL